MALFIYHAYFIFQHQTTSLKATALNRGKHPTLGFELDVFDPIISISTSYVNLRRNKFSHVSKYINDLTVIDHDF